MKNGAKPRSGFGVRGSKTTTHRTLNAELRTITFAHSPDTDDAFMFYGLAQHAVPLAGFTIQHHLEDIQSLNQRALTGEFEVTAVSVAAYPTVADQYWIMSCGASVGRNYGPVLIAKERITLSSLRGVRVAVPGLQTTAALVLQLAVPTCELVACPFDEILETVARGDVQAGVIIHEGQLFYERSGVHKLLDLGVWWQERTQLPLPLGLDVVRKDLGKALATQVTEALRGSIRYAYAHMDEALTYALQFGRGIDRKVGDKFVRMYVNDDTLSLPDDCVTALSTLYEEAHAKGLIATNPSLTII